MGQFASGLFRIQAGAQTNHLSAKGNGAFLVLTELQALRAMEQQAGGSTQVVPAVPGAAGNMDS